MRRIPKRVSSGQAHPKPSVNSRVAIADAAIAIALQVVQDWGVPIFPCDAISKAPLTPNGFHGASYVPAHIEAWWQQWPGALIGVPTGARSGLVAIDVDPKGQGWYQGVKGALGPHRLHQTRRGRHLIFRTPKELPVRNSTGQIARGVDVRGEGGYIIWWPAHGGVALGSIGELPEVLRRALKPAARKLDGHKLNGASDLPGLDAQEWEAERPRLYAALSQLDPDCSHDEWRDRGMAISWATGGSEEGADLFVQHSRGDLWSGGKAASYEGEYKTRAKYRSFKNEKDRNVTLATLYQQLKDEGKKVPAGRPDKRSNGKRATGVLQLIPAADVQERAYKWLWKWYLAVGKLHLIAGDPAHAKSTVALDLAARVSCGSTWPDGSVVGLPSDIVVWTGEDDYEDTVKPRLRAAGADMSRAFFIGAIRDPKHEEADKKGNRTFDPAHDLPVLEEAILTARRHGRRITFVVIDPIIRVVDGDTNAQNEVRKALEKVKEFAERLRICIFGVHHFTKESQGRTPLARVTGSLAFGAVTRAVYGVVRDKQDPAESRLFVRIKSNLGRDGGAFRYKIQGLKYFSAPRGSPQREQIETSRVIWVEALQGQAEEIMAVAEVGRDAPKGDIAETFLKTSLAGGPVEMMRLAKLAEDNGVSLKTLKRAKKKLGIMSHKLGGRGIGHAWVAPWNDGYDELMEKRLKGGR